MSDLHLDSGFYKQSIDIDKYFKIKERHDSSIGQSTVIQRLDNKRPKLSSSIGQSTVIQRLDNKRPTLSNLNQTQNRRRYVNFENGSHCICSFNLNNPDTTFVLPSELMV